MGYATQADLVTRYGERELIQVTDKAKPPTGDMDEAVVARALADADAEIDARIGIRYSVPLTVTPSIIVDSACRIARYKLHEDRATEKIRQDYEDALRFLAERRGNGNVQFLHAVRQRAEPARRAGFHAKHQLALLQRQLGAAGDRQRGDAGQHQQSPLAFGG